MNVAEKEKKLEFRAEWLFYFIFFMSNFAYSVSHVDLNKQIKGAEGVGGSF